MTPRTIQLSTHRSKGVNAYIAPIDESGSIEISRATYPKFEGEEAQKNYRNKFATGQVEMAKLTPGFYYWKEAIFQSARSSTGCLYWDGEEITEQWESLEEVIHYRLGLLLDLPALVGSEKQISWAELIRASTLLALRQQGFWQDRDSIDSTKLPVSAKDWIDASQAKTVTTMVLENQGWKDTQIA
jgi:hypothetical protein